MLARGNAFTGEISTCVAQSNRYDFVSGMTFATGNVLCSYPAHSDIPQEGSFDASGLIFAALGMVAAFAVVGALSLTGIGALAVGGLVFGAVTGALNASKAAYDAGITGVEYWKTVGLGALTGGVKGLFAGLAIGLAPYAAEAFIASYFPIGLMVGGTYISSAALTTMSAYGLGAISSIFATLQVNEIVSPVGSNYFRELTGMNEETYNSLSSVVSTAASAIIMMGASNPRTWSDVKSNQNSVSSVIHQGYRDIHTLSSGSNQTSANLGNKLDYLFGHATGKTHNIERSKQNLAQLSRIGIFDNTQGRNYVTSHLNSVLRDSSNILRIEPRSYTVDGVVYTWTATIRESLLVGPSGFLKVETIWNGNSLVTVTLFGRGLG